MKNNKQWYKIISKSALEVEYLTGKSWKSIAQIFGCGETTIMRLAKKYEIISRKRTYDIIGQIFGKLTVVGQAKSDCNRSKWLCKCTCGKEILVLGASLRAGRKVVLNQKL